MTPQEQYQANLALVAAKSEELARQVEQVILTNIQFVPTPSSRVVAVAWDVEGQRWIGVQDGDDPEAAARRDADALWTRDAKVFSLMGIGCGYFAAEFARRLEPHQRLSLWELNPVMLKAAMHCADLGPILSGAARVDTFVGDAIVNSLEAWWLSLQTHEKMWIGAPMRAGYTAVIDRAGYDALQAKSMDYLRYHAVGLATWSQFGHCIGDNDLDNLPEYATTPGLNEIAGRWAGRPAVCLAAGPSLAKNLALLMDPEVRRHVCVLAVGTVYVVCQAMGIVPDVVTSIDFQRLNWTDQFRDVPQDPRTALVYLHSVYPQIPRRWPGPRFVARNSSDTVNWLAPFCEPKADCSQVQTVAHLNLCVAQMLGANPIILIGQDLSSPLDAHHAPGARAQDAAPQENLAAHVNADDIYGQPVWSRHSFLSMRTVFTQLMAAHPEHRYWNCTEGGLHIDGATDRPLAEALAELRQTWVTPERPLYEALKAIHDAYVPQTKWTELKEGLDTLAAHVADLVAASKDVQQWAAAYDVIPAEIEGFPRLGGLAVVDAELSDVDGTPRMDEGGVVTMMYRRFPGSSERAELRRKILEAEKTISQDGTAFALFCVRRFDLVQALSTIPPQPEALAGEGQEELNMRRVVQAYQAIAAEAAVVRHRLRMVQRRLQDVLPEEISGIPQHFSPRLAHGLMARQQYPRIERLLWWIMQEHDPSTTMLKELPGLLWLQARLLQARGQYEDALAVARLAGIGDAATRRARALLDRYRREQVPVAARYVAGLARPVVVSEEEMASAFLALVDAATAA